jgi:hypothetical protein
MSLNIWIPAAEQAARDQANVNFAGTYKVPGAGNSVAEIAILPTEPAIYLSSLTSDGVDFFGLLKQLQGVDVDIRAWLYPTGLVDEVTGENNGTKRIAFRASFGSPGVEADDNCASWANVDRGRFGGYPGDLFIFHVDEKGSATALEIPVLGKTYGRVRV